MAGQFDRAIAAQSLRALQAEIGGKIRGRKLYPLGDAFASLVLPEPNVTFERRTFVLQVLPQKETTVYDALLKEGLSAWLPKVPHSVRVNATKRRTVLRPMLTGYVFPIFDVHRDRWQVIPEMKEVVRLFMIQERPVPVPQDELQRIKDREFEANMRGKPIKAPAWVKVGTVVQFTDMPWQGFVGQVETLLADGERIKVAVDVFGRQTPVEVSVNQVRAV